MAVERGKKMVSAPGMQDQEWVPDDFQRQVGGRMPEPSDEFTERQAEFPSDLMEEIGHVVLPVSNLDRSEDWYVNFLQIDLVGRNLLAEEKPHSVLRTNRGQLVVLVEDPDAPAIRPGTMGMHQSFKVTPNQYIRMMLRARDAGFELANLRAARMVEGEYEFHFADPDGHSIEFGVRTEKSTRILLSGAGVVDCGLPSDYRVGDVKTFHEGKFFLVRQRDGFLAISQWCTHENGLLAYRKSHWEFHCPFHHATFDRRGDVTDGPAELALRLHPIRLGDNGHILVDTNAVIHRECFEPSQAVSFAGARG